MKGTDHACSLEPHELTAMVKSIREVEAALGEPKKVSFYGNIQDRRIIGWKIAFKY